MIKYFIPNEEQGLLERQKAIALMWIMLSLFFLLLVLLIQSLYSQAYFSASDYFLPVGQVFVLCVLFILRKYGLKKAGNVFSIGAVLIMTIVINIFDEDTIFTKYAEELYLAIFALVFISLFSSRKILLFAAIIFFISSLRASFYLQETFIEQVEILREIQMFFSFTLINITLILYFATKFSDDALLNARRDARIKDEQNKALEIEEQKAKESELLYRNIVNNLVGGFYKTDIAGNIVLVSPSVLKITGFEENEIIGKPISSFLMNPDTDEDFFSMTKTKEKLELYKAELRTKVKGNIIIETNAKVVQSNNGAYNGVEGIFYDISERRRMEFEIEKYQNSLEELVQQKTDKIEESNQELIAINEALSSQHEEVLEQKNRIDEQNIELTRVHGELKEANLTLEEKVNIRTRELEESNRTLAKAVKELDRFVYSASHDLGAPLKSILGLVNIAKLENKDKNLLVYLNYIEESIAKQEVVIANLIQYSKNARQVVAKEPIDLYELIGQVADDLRYMPDCENIKLINNISEGQTVHSDALRIKMILNNLLNNSIKYRTTQKDDSYVKIDFKEQGSMWSLTVSDNGQGIPEDQQDKIFDMFYRANKGSEGSGLGLFIVREAVELLGGKISLTSSFNEGTTFYLEFPNSDFLDS